MPPRICNSYNSGFDSGALADLQSGQLSDSNLCSSKFKTVSQQIGHESRLDSF